uniref:Uncharacterized protein n=1 Tax=Strigamia maritima TaxID=126957 RepID=T1J5S2_STRMM
MECQERICVQVYGWGVQAFRILFTLCWFYGAEKLHGMDAVESNKHGGGKEIVYKLIRVAIEVLGVVRCSAGNIFSNMKSADQKILKSVNVQILYQPNVTNQQIRKLKLYVKITANMHHSKSLDNVRKSSDNHSKSLDNQNNHSKSSDHHSKSSDHHSKSSDHHSKSSDHHSKSLDNHSKFSDNHSKSSDHHSKSSDHHSKSSDHHSKSSDHHSKSSDHHSKSSDHHSKSSENHNFGTYFCYQVF